MTFFITGISTEVGKTVASAIVVEALAADYWKPIQAGDLNHSDSHKIEALISNDRTVIHPNSYALNTPMSPHAAADIDGISIQLDKIVPPTTKNDLVIEGAGGLLVPLNKTDTIYDLIQPDYKVIVVSRHYLGSINHTLLTIEKLQQKGVAIGIIFSGNEHPTTEEIILKKTGAVFLGRINEEKKFNKEVVKKYAAAFHEALLSF
ncbi:dethiobiotin synthase [Flagellimonas aequoris]|uniref:ATP-dependent dethiobiotin synthetase BioD n=1 Tax=Flagellimonas aequoris TaxID=2306997 RepID=A0A418N783_9FLAO|nr:dethiobiotin synthase [Allomuricauda aequoris]RIV70739.1 dethiobiotin synthase [Allomuricauda aequoris]TXK02178.1 dethiobiotin synthase [Allomuricauda aequoris]